MFVLFCNSVYTYIYILTLQILLFLALRQVHNKLREEVNRLQEENNVLDTQVTELQVKADQVTKCEQNLSAITDSQGTNVAAFVDSVKQNGIVQNKIEELLLVEVMQNILTAVIRADTDMNFQIGEHEMQMLLIRIKSLPGVENVEEAQIRQLLQESGGGIHNIVSLVKNLHKADVSRRLVHVSSRALVL